MGGTIREKLVAYVGADISQYVKGVGRDVPRHAKTAASAIKRLGRAGATGLRILGRAAGIASGAISSIASVASSVARRGLYAFTAAATAATYEAIQFESAMAEVASISGKVHGSIGAVSKDVRALAAAYGKAPTEMAKGLYQTISAGIQDPGEAMKLLGTASKAAIAGLTDVRTSVDVLTSAVNAYGKGAEWAGHASDVLFTAVKEGKTTFPELASTMGRVMGIAAQAGVSLEELAASVTTLTKGGFATDLAVTSVRQAIVSVIKPSKEASDLAAKLGIDFSASALAAKGLGGVLADVARATRGDAEALGSLFPNVRALSGVMSLAGGQAGEFQRQLKLMGESAGATQKAFSIMADTTRFKLAQAWASIRGSFGKMGSVLLPTVEKAAAGIARVIGRAADWVDKHSEEIKATLTDISVFFKKVFTQIEWAVSDALYAMKGDNATVWDAITKKGKGAWETIKGIWKGAKEIIKPLVKAVGDAMKGDWDAAMSGLGEATAKGIDLIVKGLVVALPRFIDLGIKFLGGVIQGLKDNETLDKISELVSAVWQRLTSKENVAMMIDAGKTLAIALANAMRKALLENLPVVGDYLRRNVAAREEAFTEMDKQGWVLPEGYDPDADLSGTGGSTSAPGDSGGGRSSAPKAAGDVTVNYYYPTGREPVERLAEDLARLARRGRVAPAR